MQKAELSVTSHVGRDLLQSASLFKHEHSVAWEYASNGLQYVDVGTKTLVRISINQSEKTMIISDNGRGMSFADLEGYFTMHGENADRKSGRPGRGMFGTGKSAAFGIANKLRVTTTRNGLRSIVELHRTEIASENAKSSVPVRVVERDVPSKESNGTTVEISEINLKPLDVGSIIKEIERHIAHWPNATVFVGHHECAYIEPAAATVEKITTKGTPLEPMLRDVELILKVAKAPLASENQGVSITSGGVLHETTLAGCDRRPFANYVFGQIEVPSLATDKSPITPFDMSRSMKLNPQNETVQAIHAFLGMNIERVCRELEKQDRARRQREDSQHLQREADAIADMINQDFKNWRGRIQQVLSKTSGAHDKQPAIVSGDGEELGGDGDISATLVADDGGIELGGGGGVHVTPKRSGPTYRDDKEGVERVAKKQTDPNRTSSGGGFKVDFREMGAEEARARYDRQERTILINLDHPQILAAKGVGGIEDAAFKRLSYEVAFSEYAIALAVELANEGYFLDPSEPITEIRETMNRLATLAAVLYR